MFVKQPLASPRLINTETGASVKVTLPQNILILKSSLFLVPNLCLHSMSEAKSAWLPCMCGLKSALLPSMTMCGAKYANLLCTCMGAMQTLLCTWKGAMQTLLRTLSGNIVSGTNTWLKLQFLVTFKNIFVKPPIYDLCDHF